MNSNKKKIISITVIILLNFIPNFLSRCLVNRLTKILKKEHNIFFRIENPGLRGIKKFTFNSVYIKTDKFKIILKNGLITINLHAFFQKRSFQEIVKIFDFGDVFFLAISSKPSKNLHRNTGGNDRFCLEAKYYSFFRKSIERFWHLSFSGSIKRIVFISSFYNEKVSLLLKDLDIIENSIKGYVEIGIKDYWVRTPFELHKNSNERKIEINNPQPGKYPRATSAKKNHLFSFSGYRITYMEKDNSNYTLLAEITDIIISNHNILPDPVLIKKLESEQLIRFTENEFRILKESSLNFDGISTFMEFYHCCSESDLLRMSIIFFLDGTDFLEKFLFLSTKNIRCLKVSGDIALKLDYMTSFNDFSTYYFNSEILQNTLEIERGNEFDLSYLSGDFKHKVNNFFGVEKVINISKPTRIS